MSAHDNEELIDYEDEHDVVTSGAPATAASNGAVATAASGADGEGEKLRGSRWCAYVGATKTVPGGMYLRNASETGEKMT